MLAPEGWSPGSSMPNPGAFRMGLKAENRAENGLVPVCEPVGHDVTLQYHSEPYSVTSSTSYVSVLSIEKLQNIVRGVL